MTFPTLGLAAKTSLQNPSHFRPLLVARRSTGDWHLVTAASLHASARLELQRPVTHLSSCIVGANRYVAPVMIETVRCTYPLRPGTLAERALLAEWRRRRFHWNEAVRQQESSNRPTFSKLPRVPNESHHPYARLRGGSQVAPQQTLRMHTQALDHSFKVQGRRRPTATSRRKSLPPLNCTVRGLSIGGGRLILPKNASIPIVYSRGLPSDPTSVRVMVGGVRTASVQPLGRVLRTVKA